MLTREQAKTKECPYRINNMYVLIEDLYKQHDTLLKEGGRETKADALQKAYEASLCIAEDCPKWIDISDDSCSKYGRCGG